MVKLFRMYSNLCDHYPPTLQTDRQTTCERNTALCTKVHRAVITIWAQKHFAYARNSRYVTLSYVTYFLALVILKVKVAARMLLF